MTSRRFAHPSGVGDAAAGADKLPAPEGPARFAEVYMEGGEATPMAQRILELLEEIELDAAVDFAGCDIDRDLARHLVVRHLSQLHEHLCRCVGDAEGREALLLATAARVMLENVVLQARVLAGRGRVAGGELGALLERLGVGGV